MATRPPLARVADLHLAYPGGPEVLHGISLTVPAGQFTAIVGPSGAGKSTLLRIIAGVADGYRGTVELFGTALAGWGPQLYTHVGVAFERPTHYRKLSGRENLALFAALQPGPTRRPEELLAAVGLADAADERVGAYAKGMAVRLGTARALLAEHVADRILVLVDGRVEATAAPEELRAGPDALRVQVSAGTPGGQVPRSPTAPGCSRRFRGSWARRRLSAVA